MCQFRGVKENFDEFISLYKIHGKEIDREIKSKTPKVLDDRDFFYKKQIAALKSLKNEAKLLKANANLEGSDTKYWNEKAEKILSHEGLALSQLHKETRRRWKNRKIILNKTIEHMRFVKIEMLSSMRNLNNQLAINLKKDQVSTYQAATAKSGQLEFPHDGILFGDELFNITATAKSLCLKGKK